MWFGGGGWWWGCDGRGSDGGVMTLTFSCSSSSTTISSVFSQSLSDLSWPADATKSPLADTARHSTSAWWPYTHTAALGKAVANHTEVRGSIHSKRTGPWNIHLKCGDELEAVWVPLLQLPVLSSGEEEMSLWNELDACHTVTTHQQFHHNSR